MIRHRPDPGDVDEREPVSVALRTRIIDHVIKRITGGEWRSGDMLPSERELMADFSASRMTVHNALRELASRGFLTRRKGAGTFVAPPRPYATRFDHLDVIMEITARGGTHSAKIIRREIRMASPEEAIEFDSNGPLFHAVVLHRENGKPVELEDRLIDPIAVPDCASVDLTKRSLFSMLMLVRPYRQGSETIKPILPAPGERKLLEIPAGQPALEVVRKTWTPTGVITTARLIRVGTAAIMQGRISSGSDQE